MFLHIGTNKLKYVPVGTDYLPRKLAIRVELNLTIQQL